MLGETSKLFYRILNIIIIFTLKQDGMVCMTGNNRNLTIILSAFILNIAAVNCESGEKLMSKAIIFAAYAESDEQLQHTIYMTESIRQFTGQYTDAITWIYISEEYTNPDTLLLNKLQSFGVEIKTSAIPKESSWLYYAGKVFAAGLAETEADGECDILVWMDEDTIILREPVEFMLPESIDFAYRPVMHNRSGSLYSEPPDKFWGRIYDLLNIKNESLFSMVTPGDQQTIRVYFNAGLLVLRPEKGILRKWADDFKVLYSDSVLTEMCKEDITKRIFLHQTPLVGLLNTVSKDQMIELPDTYNYPIFFHQQYETIDEFCSIEDVITLRYDVYFRDPDPEWSKKLIGSSAVIEWLAERLGRN
jgi:hypothetical protein